MAAWLCVLLVSWLFPRDPEHSPEVPARVPECQKAGAWLTPKRVPRGRPESGRCGPRLHVTPPRHGVNEAPLTGDTEDKVVHWVADEHVTRVSPGLRPARSDPHLPASPLRVLDLFVPTR